MCHFYFKGSYAAINSYVSWNVWVTLTENTKEELCFLNGQLTSGATQVVFTGAKLMILIMVGILCKWTL